MPLDLPSLCSNHSGTGLPRAGDRNEGESADEAIAQGGHVGDGEPRTAAIHDRLRPELHATRARRRDEVARGRPANFAGVHSGLRLFASRLSGRSTEDPRSKQLLPDLGPPGPSSHAGCARPRGRPPWVRRFRWDGGGRALLHGRVCPAGVVLPAWRESSRAIHAEQFPPRTRPSARLAVGFHPRDNPTHSSCGWLSPAGHG